MPASFGTALDGQSEFGYDLNSAYLEDTVDVWDDLRMSFGLRYDWFKMSDRPVLNNNFAIRNGFSNQNNLDGKDLYMPRVAFEYSPGEWKITGGVGKFSAIGTNVQISNIFANDGVRITQVNCAASSLKNITDLSVVPAGCGNFVPGSGNAVALDPNFEIPSAWKTNLSVRRMFEAPYIGAFRVQVDGIYTTFEDALYYKDLRAIQTGVAPDGRPVYGRRPVPATPVGLANDWDLLLTNLTDGGNSKSAAITVGKYVDEGLFAGADIQAVYTYTEFTDGNPMTSSQPDSSYVRFASTDHNNPRIAVSDYETRHRFGLTVNYEREFWGDNATSATMFLQYRSGLPYSFVFHNSRTSNLDNDFGNVVPQSYSGAFGTSNQLFYVPQTDGGQVTATSDPRVIYATTGATAIDLGQFNAFLKSTGLLRYSGKVAPRNAFRGDGVTTIDLRLSQEIPAPFVPTGKFKLYADIENFGNMLNKKWGVVEQYPFYRGVGTVDVRCVLPAAPTTTVNCGTAGSVFSYSTLQQPAVTQAGAPTGVARRPPQLLPASVWQVKFGARFDF